MWNAIHKETGRNIKAYDAVIEFEKPHKEEWYCCNIHKYPVTPVKSHQRKGKLVLDHFRMISNHFCPGESDIHWNLKVEVAKQIEEGGVKFKFKKDKIAFIFKQCSELVERLEITKKNRRADVLFEFEKYSPTYGYGIVIEIAVSENIDSLRKKTIDWIKNRYSVIWIHENDDFKTIEIKYVQSLYFDIIKFCNDLKWNKNQYINWSRLYG